MIDLVFSWLFQAIDSFVKWNPKVFLLRNHASEKNGSARTLWGRLSREFAHRVGTWLRESKNWTVRGFGGIKFGKQLFETGHLQVLDQQTDQIIPKSFKIYSFQETKHSSRPQNLRSPFACGSPCRTSPAGVLWSTRSSVKCDQSWWLRNQPFSNEWS